MSGVERAGRGDPDLAIAVLSREHDRAPFACGVPAIDAYLKERARQDLDRLANGVFVLGRADAPRRILGYYTLAASALAPGDVPPALRKHLARYPLVSATLIGRLAVDQEVQGTGLGGVLLADALLRAHASAKSVGSSMVVVDALDERAARFYAAHGFVALPESPRLVLPMRTLARQLE